MAVCGIYKITNKETGKCYVGQSIDIFNRLKQHTSTKYDENDWHNKLQMEPEKYTFEILTTCEKKDLNDLESYYIYKYDSVNNGYNKTKGNHSIFKNMYYEESNQIIEPLLLTVENTVETPVDIITFNPQVIFNNNLSSMDADVLIYYIYITESHMKPHGRSFQVMFNKHDSGDTYNRYNQSRLRLNELNIIQKNDILNPEIIASSSNNIQIDIQKYINLKTECSKYSLFFLCLIEYLRQVKKDTIYFSDLKVISNYTKNYDTLRFVVNKSVNLLNKYYYETPISFKPIKKQKAYHAIQFRFS